MGLFAFRIQGNPLRNLWIGFGFNRKRSVFIALGTAVLLLTGCSDFVDHDQAIVSPDLSVILEPEHPVGQTFVARHGGLSGMEFWLEAQPGSAGVLRLHLRSDPQSSIRSQPPAFIASPSHRTIAPMVFIVMLFWSWTVRVRCEWGLPRAMPT